MTKKVISGVVVAILIFGLGVLVGIIASAKKTATKTSSLPQNSQDTFQAGWDAAKKRLQEKGAIGLAPAGLGGGSISGTVQKISGNVITLTSVSSADTLSDPSLDTRTVQITKDTKIIQFSQKDPQQLQKEMADFQSKMQNIQNDDNSINAAAVPPMQQEQKDVTVGDIKEGQVISVTASEDIRDKKDVTAIEISF